ncbi:hypothetical protein FHS68_001891 [Dyadobacter arcticus]|uniref:Uncharacterized protein n=1 Tax=Dyadobacter arcticus TaxID=1078754 RepID=A0ABX0UIF9_9BACT|nr:hypothetical protein [Dyadobacter arcticus]
MTLVEQRKIPPQRETETKYSQNEIRGLYPINHQINPI